MKIIVLFSLVLLGGCITAPEAPDEPKERVIVCEAEEDGDEVVFVCREES